MWRKSIPLPPWVITQIPPWGLWNGFLGIHCYSSAFFVVPLWRKSNMLSGLTSASPSHLIWLNCSGKCYSGLWLCPYLPSAYSKHWSAFTCAFFSHSVSPLPFPVTEARQGDAKLLFLSHSLASFLINRHCFRHLLPLWSCDSNGLILKCTFMLSLTFISSTLLEWYQPAWVIYCILIYWTVLSPLFLIHLPFWVLWLHYL